VKAVPQLGIVLGDETEAEGHAFVGKEYEAPLGAVTIEFQGMGALHISSEDPVALRVVEEAFRAARWHLLEIIAEKRNSALANAPGADALGEAASGAAEGEQPPSRPAAPPSNPPDGGL
jgi:hypothetical protein